MPSPEGAIPRPAARIILLDSRDRILLFRLQSDSRPGHSWWITPGGGLDAGETYRTAALRELREETGLTGVRISRCVWRREHTFAWGGRLLHQIERYFVARTPAWTVDTRDHTEEEVRMIVDHRWWSLPEIATSDQDFAPRRLATFLAPILAGELPRRPLPVGD